MSPAPLYYSSSPPPSSFNPRAVHVWYKHSCRIVLIPPNITDRSSKFDCLDSKAISAWQQTSWEAFVLTVIIV